MWTVDKVKAELPNVQCQFCNKVYNCRIYGGLNQFAIVWAKIDQYLQATFAWEKIVYSLNNNRPLRAD